MGRKGNLFGRGLVVVSILAAGFSYAQGPSTQANAHPTPSAAVDYSTQTPLFEPTPANTPVPSTPTPDLSQIVEQNLPENVLYTCEVLNTRRALKEPTLLNLEQNLILNGYGQPETLPPGSVVHVKNDATTSNYCDGWNKTPGWEEYVQVTVLGGPENQQFEGAWLLERTGGESSGGAVYMLCGEELNQGRVLSQSVNQYLDAHAELRQVQWKSNEEYETSFPDLETAYGILLMTSEGLHDNVVRNMPEPWRTEQKARELAAVLLTARNDMRMRGKNSFEQILGRYYGLSDWSGYYPLRLQAEKDNEEVVFNKRVVPPADLAMMKALYALETQAGGLNSIMEQAGLQNIIADCSTYIINIGLDSPILVGGQKYSMMQAFNLNREKTVDVGRQCFTCAN